MTSKAIWTPSQSMAENEQHTATVTGTVQDSTGTVRPVDFNAWTFKTVDPANPDILFQSNFQQFTANTDFTASQLPQAFNWYGGPGAGFGEPDGRQWAFWRNDPEGVRGTVLVYETAPNATGSSGSKIDQDIDWSLNHDQRNAVGEDEIWVAYDLYLSPGFVMPVSSKLPGPESRNSEGHVPGGAPRGGWCAAAFGISGDASDEFLAAGCPDHPGIGYHPYPYRNGDKTGIASYYHSMQNEQCLPDCENLYYRRVREMNKDNPTIRIRSNTAAQQYNASTGQWIRCLANYKMNSLPAGSNPGDTYTYQFLENNGHKNGYAHFYVNGQLMWDTGNTIWRNDTQVKWNNVRMHHFYGGSTSNFSSPCQPQWIALDDVVVSLTNPDA